MSRTIALNRMFFPAAALFQLTAAFLVVRTGRDALYFQDDGLMGLPKAYVAIAMFSVPQAMAVLAAIARMGARATRLSVLGLVVAGVGAMAIFGRPGGGPLMTGFFTMVPLVFAIAFSLTWLLGTELTEGMDAQATAESFARFGASSIMGGAAGSLMARSLATSVEPNALLLVGAGLVATTLVTVFAAHRAFPYSPPTPSDPSEPLETRPGMFDGVAVLASNQRVRLLLLVAMAAALASILIEFIFYVGASQRQPDDNTVFFANVYLALAGISLALQLVVAPLVQRFLGLSGGLLILPLAVAGGVASLAANSGVGMRAGVRITEGSIKSGIHRSMWEQTFRTIPSSLRPSVKVLIDSMATRLAEGAAAATLWFWLAGIEGTSGAPALGSWIFWTLAAAAVAWLASAIALARSLRGELEPIPAAGPDQVTIDGACVGTAAFGRAAESQHCKRQSTR